jgi:hypothetical protein
MEVIQVAPDGKYQAFRHDPVTDNYWPSQIFGSPAEALFFVRGRNEGRKSKYADQFCARDDQGRFLL